MPCVGETSINYSLAGIWWRQCIGETSINYSLAGIWWRQCFGETSINYSLAGIWWRPCVGETRYRWPASLAPTRSEHLVSTPSLTDLHWHYPRTRMPRASCTDTRWSCGRRSTPRERPGQGYGGGRRRNTGSSRAVTGRHTQTAAQTGHRTLLWAADLRTHQVRQVRAVTVTLTNHLI